MTKAVHLVRSIGRFLIFFAGAAFGVSLCTTGANLLTSVVVCLIYMLGIWLSEYTSQVAKGCATDGKPKKRERYCECGYAIYENINACSKCFKIASK